MPAEKPRHVDRRLEVAFGVRPKLETGLGNRHAEADRRQDVLQGALAQGMVERVIGRHQRHPCHGGHCCGLLDPEAVVTAEIRRNRQPQGGTEPLLETAEKRNVILRGGGDVGQDCK